MKKYCLILFMFVVFLKNALSNSESVDKKIDKLEKEIQIIKQKQDFGFKMHGRFHIEYENNNKIQKLKEKNNKLNDIQDDIHKFTLRRSKVYLLYLFNEKLKFNATIQARFKSVFFEDVGFFYKPNKNLELSIGELVLSTNLEGENSANLVPNTDFVNGLFYGIIKDTALGVKIDYSSYNYGMIFGLFGDYHMEEPNKETNFILSGRVYYLPYKTENSLLHLGLNAYYSELSSIIKNSTNKNLLINKLNDNGEYTDFIDLRTYKMRNVKKIGFESLFVKNNYYIMSEYARVRTNPLYLNFGDNVYDFYNFYIQFTIALTGEAYEYRNGCIKSYKVSRPITENGFGAFEFSFIYYKEDLSDFGKSMHDVPNKKINRYTMSLNWSPVDDFRTFLTYSNIFTEANRYDKIQFTVKMFF